MDYRMSQALYSKFRADLLEWCEFYRTMARNDCEVVGKVALDATRKQMAHLRQAYFIGDITY